MASDWWKVARAGWRVSSAANRSAHNGAASILNNRLSRGAKQGILGPGDPPPPPHALQAGLWDYRGVARPRDIPPVSADFPLGRYIEPRRWSPGQRFWLSAPIANEHTIALGPTRSGKTASVIAPWIHHALGLGYSVLAVDVKGKDELLNEVKRYSAYHGPLGVPVLKWDYADPARSVSWDWIADLRDDGEVNAAVEAVCGRPSPSDPNKFFHQSAIKYLRGLLQLAPTMRAPLTLEGMIALLGDQRALESLVNARRGHPGSTRLAELTGLSPGEFLKYTMELKTHLEALDTSGFHAVTRSRQFSFDGLWNSRRAVLMIVNAPVADGALADAACSLFLGQFIQRALSGFGRASSPILLVLDEGARVQRRLELGTTLSLVAGAGISVLLATQDVTQFDDDCRDEILANCGTMICLPRVSRATTDYLAGRLGEMQFASMTRSTSQDRRVGGSQSWTHSSERAAVLGHREIAAPPREFGGWPAIVHSPSVTSKPIVVDLTRLDLVP